MSVTLIPVRSSLVRIRIRTGPRCRRRRGRELADSGVDLRALRAEAHFHTAAKGRRGAEGQERIEMIETAG